MYKYLHSAFAVPHHSLKQKLRLCFRPSLSLLSWVVPAQRKADKDESEEDEAQAASVPSIAADLPTHDGTKNITLNI